ncbi:MAG: hypothetical protein NUV63_07265, partial [Gallionella sp.]|nr:hypothetical protein [Gallionella sp.]
MEKERTATAKTDRRREKNEETNTRNSSADIRTGQLSDTFHQAAQKIPDLVSMVLDGSLFGANALDDKPDLLRTLLRHQLGVAGVVQPDDMLNRFSADMNSLVQAQSGGAATYQDLGKALIAFAMEKYYTETT